MDYYDKFNRLNLAGKMSDRGLATFFFTMLFINLILSITLSGKLYIFVVLLIFTIVYFQANFNLLADNEFNLYRFQHLGYAVFITAIMLNIVIAMGIGIKEPFSKTFMVMYLFLIMMKFIYVVRVESSVYSQLGNIEYTEIVRYIKQNKDYLYILNIVFSSLIYLQIYVYTTLDNINFVANLILLVILVSLYNLSNLYSHNKQPIFHNLLFDRKDYVTITLVEQNMYDKIRKEEGKLDQENTHNESVELDQENTHKES